MTMRTLVIAQSIVNTLLALVAIVMSLRSLRSLRKSALILDLLEQQRAQKQIPLSIYMAGGATAQTELVALIEKGMKRGMPLGDLRRQVKTRSAE